ncbi:MAG: hypothetical protein M1834_007833 [Cirrosporium novae-zelandiae]|nr:MAG: hypothetical protein M1834_007833 [Cirrosporium novae-zelandiae]
MSSAVSSYPIDCDNEAHQTHDRLDAIFSRLILMAYLFTSELSDTSSITYSLSKAFPFHLDSGNSRRRANNCASCRDASIIKSIILAYECPSNPRENAFEHCMRQVDESKDGDYDGDGPVAKKQRPWRNTATPIRIRSSLLVNDVLTLKVWMELWEYFQLHFSTELSFLHPPTFRADLRDTVEGREDAHADRKRSSPKQTSPLILLGILTLCARFHPSLVAYFSPPGLSTPLKASQYYADALRARINGVNGSELATPSLDRVQAFLMLSLYEWGMCRGREAWGLVGYAIRMAQNMELEEIDGDATTSIKSRDPEGCQSAPYQNSSHMCQDYHVPKVNNIVEKEILRRTFWSCFIMDRYTSNGKNRKQMIRIEDIKVQLPCSDSAFAIGQPVKTCRLPLHKSEPSDCELQPIRGSNLPRLEIGHEEGVLSLVIKIVALWSKVAQWSCNGGRRTERFPPWDMQSQFAQFMEDLKQFQADLPQKFAFTLLNIRAQIAHNSASAASYTFIHTVYFLCLIILHREYVPFSAVRCKSPMGPLDQPTFPPNQYKIPHNFWEESGSSLFKAARDIIDLVRVCHQERVLTETPMMGFAIYTVAFVGIYAIKFPWMDPNRYMCSESEESSANTIAFSNRGRKQTQRAMTLLIDMQSRLCMATGWLRTIRTLNNVYNDVLKNAPDVWRGEGGGLEEWTKYEDLFTEFGSIRYDAFANGIKSPPSIKEEDQSVQEFQGGRDPGDKVETITIKRRGGSISAPARLAVDVLSDVNKRPSLPPPSALLSASGSFDRQITSKLGRSCSISSPTSLPALISPESQTTATTAPSPHQSLSSTDISDYHLKSGPGNVGKGQAILQSQPLNTAESISLQPTPTLMTPANPRSDFFGHSSFTVDDLSEDFYGSLAAPDVSALMNGTRNDLFDATTSGLSPGSFPKIFEYFPLQLNTMREQGFNPQEF